jgi:hypothetical protein
MLACWDLEGGMAWILGNFGIPRALIQVFLCRVGILCKILHLIKEFKQPCQMT